MDGPLRATGPTSREGGIANSSELMEHPVRLLGPVTDPTTQLTHDRRPPTEFFLGRLMTGGAADREVVMTLLPIGKVFMG